MTWDGLTSGLALFGGLCAALLALLGLVMLARFAWHFLRGIAAGAGVGSAALRPPSAFCRHAGSICGEPRCTARLRGIGGDSRSVDYRCRNGHAWSALLDTNLLEDAQLHRWTFLDHPSPEAPAAQHDVEAGEVLS